MLTVYMTVYMEKFKKKYIGDRAFYKMLFAVAIPIMIQNGITNFVGMLDNLMVGRLGTEPMSGVSIVNQIMFVYYLCVFGGLAGAGIFTAQYFGSGDEEGIRNTFRYKLWLAVTLSVLAILVMLTAGDNLIGLFLNESEGGGDLAATLRYGRGYMNIILLGIPFFCISNVYASSMRECGETIVPMRAGVIAVFVNLVFNYLLIFGKLGFPRLGVYGAAAATDISRIFEMLILVIWLHSHTDRFPFAEGLYRTLKVPVRTVKKIFVTGTPMLVNEAFWSTGFFLLNQAYSTRGLNVVAANGIASTIYNVFSIAFIALGDSVAILIGRLLGAGKMKEAKETDTRIIAFSVMIGTVLTVMMLVTAPFFPRLYNTSSEVRHLATMFLVVQAFFAPKEAFLNTTYFTIRSGGRTVVTFFFDSVFMCVVSVPLAFYLTRFTALDVIVIFAIVNAADLIKCTIGYILVRKNVWMRNIVT